MKVQRMGLTQILRRIWLFSANMIKSSESVSKQPTQLIIAVEIRHIFFFINRYVTSATVKSSWGHPGESVTNLDISYLVVFTLQIVCDAILVWGAMKKIPNHLVPWLWANAVIIAVFLVSIFAVSKKLEMTRTCAVNKRLNNIKVEKI